MPMNSFSIAPVQHARVFAGTKRISGWADRFARTRHSSTPPCNEQSFSGYANRAIVTTASPDGLGDVRTRETIAHVANQWLQSGAQDNAQFAANFLTTIRRFPADQIPGLENKFFMSTANPAQPVFRQLTPADINPVAINILNVKRSGQLLLPSVTATNRLLPGNATFGQEREQVNAFPTFFNSWAGSGTLEHNFNSNDRVRLNYIRSQQFVEEAFPWANSSVSPTLGLTPGYVASLSHTHTFGPYWTNELRGGFFELFNTRISKFRDIFNSTLGIFNPLEQAVGGLASLMPTVEIVTQRSSAGIGNAWDFYDRQRNAYVTDLVTRGAGAHTFQFGAEARRTNLKGEYMARTNGDLDYENWILFFTGHGASGGGSDLDQGDTRRDYNMFDFSLFAQDEWRVRKGLTITMGVRWDYYGWPTETAGRIGTYYNQADAARAGIEPGYYINQNHLIFKSISTRSRFPFRFKSRAIQTAHLLGAALVELRFPRPSRLQPRTSPSSIHSSRILLCNSGPSMCSMSSFRATCLISAM